MFRQAAQLMFFPLIGLLILTLILVAILNITPKLKIAFVLMGTWQMSPRGRIFFFLLSLWGLLGILDLFTSELIWGKKDQLVRKTFLNWALCLTTA